MLGFEALTGGLDDFAFEDYLNCMCFFFFYKFYLFQFLKFSLWEVFAYV